MQQEVQYTHQGSIRHARANRPRRLGARWRDSTRVSRAMSPDSIPGRGPALWWEALGSTPLWPVARSDHSHSERTAARRQTLQHQ
jgi:hypothetical protein